MMTKNNSIVAFYSSHLVAEAAFKDLQHQRLAITTQNKMNNSRRHLK
jgi:hypothetical protein